MNFTENESKISIEEAIQISKILCQTPEERLPMILSVLENADVSISGLEELAEWKSMKDQTYLFDVHEFMDAVKEEFKEEASNTMLYMSIPAEKFSDFCIRMKLKPILVKRCLARCGYLDANTTSGGKVEYTKNVWRNGHAERHVILWKEQKHD